MATKAFIFYKSFYDAAKCLDEGTFARFVKMMLDYCFEGTVPEESGSVEYMLFTLAKPQIEANNKRYENGCKGGRPKKVNSETDGFGNVETDGFTESETDGFGNVEPKKKKKKEKEKEEEIEKENIGTFVPLFSPSVEEALSTFIELRQKKGALTTSKSVAIIRRKVANLYRTDAERLEGINKAILHGWKDLYPLDYQKSKNGFTDPSDDALVQELKIN